MLVGNIKDFSKKDFAYSNNLQKARDFINEKGLEGLLLLPIGKTVIEEGEVFINRQSYTGKEFKDAKIEGHEKWIDIQIVLKNVEEIGYVDKRKYNESNVTSPYDEIKDKANYEGELDSIVKCEAGYFCQVLPNDLHKPCIKVNEEKVEKAVFKVKIDF